MHEEQQYVCMAQTSNNKRLQHMISIAACCHSVKLCALAACVFGHFGSCYLAKGPTARRKYFDKVFIGNLAGICIFWDLDGLSSISGSKVKI